MSISELLPYLNLLLPPMLAYVVGIERRLTRLEAMREAERAAREESHWTHRRATDLHP